MKAIVVTDQAAGTAGMRLVKRAKPQAAIVVLPKKFSNSRRKPPTDTCPTPFTWANFCAMIVEAAS